jgi:hypothetical protein
MKSVKPDPVTGKIGVDALMKSVRGSKLYNNLAITINFPRYLMEGNNPHLTNVLQNGARMIEQRRRDSVDWSTIDFTALPIQSNVTWWFKLTKLTDGGTSRTPAKFMLECMTYGDKIDATRHVDKYRLNPRSDEVLKCVPQFIFKIS